MQRSKYSSTLILLIIATLLTLLPSTTHARQPPTSFCKCICFTNSTIIPLNSSPQSQPDSSNPRLRPRDEDADGHDSTAHKRLTCNDCTRAFCLDYNLAICKGAKEENVFTSCFQRDSLKDETIVLLFIVVTSGLLGWAILRPWVDKIWGNETIQRYTPVGNLGGRGGDSGTRQNRGLPAYRDGSDGRPRTGDSGTSESFARQGGLNS